MEMAEDQGHQRWKVLGYTPTWMLGYTPTWILKAPMMMSGIGIERGKDLGVKEQRKINQQKQYCDNRQ